MAELGSINIKIGAVTKGLDAGLSKARNKLSNFANQAKRIGMVMGGVGAAVAAAVAAIAGLTMVSVKAAREIRTLSRVAGATPQQLQRMAFAARTVNVEQEKLADILKDTQDRVGDFIQTGGGPMADFFENIAPKIGMTAKEFQNLSGPEALQKFYNGLERSNLSMSEQIFHMEALASDSSRLIPLLRDNGAGFAEMAAQADRLGIVMSDIEVETLAQTGDKISEIGQLFKSAGNEIALKFSPMIQAATKKIKELVESAGGIKNIVGDAFGAVVRIIRKFLDVLHDVRLGFDIISKAVLEFSLKTQKAFYGAQKAARTFTGQFDKMEGLINENAMLDTELKIALLGNKIKEEFGNPLPSENLDAWLAKQDAITKQAAENAVIANKAMAGVGGNGGGQFDAGGNPINIQEQEAMKGQLESLERFLADREELINLDYEKRFEQLKKFNEADLISDEDYTEKKKELERKRMEDLYNIRASGLGKISDLVSEEYRAQARVIEGQLDNMINATSKHSKTMFNIQKTKAIAEALIKGRQAVVGAYQFGSDLGGPPLGALMAGVAAAATAAQINSIKSTTFGGGGSVTASGSSGGGQTSAQNVQDRAPRESTNRLDVTLSGVSEDQLFSGAQIRGLINRINDELDDGAVIGNLRFQ